MTGVMMTAIFGLVDGALDPTYVSVLSSVVWLMISLTLRVAEVWHKDSDFIGLIYCMSILIRTAQTLMFSDCCHSCFLHWTPIRSSRR
jgi:hypothetical protein